MIPAMDNKGTVQIVQMCRLICVFVGGFWHKQVQFLDMALLHYFAVFNLMYCYCNMKSSLFKSSLKRKSVLYPWLSFVRCIVLAILVLLNMVAVLILCVWFHIPG